MSGGGYREELEAEMAKTDPNSHASRLVAQGRSTYTNLSPTRPLFLFVFLFLVPAPILILLYY